MDFGEKARRSAKSNPSVASTQTDNWKIAMETDGIVLSFNFFFSFLSANQITTQTFSLDREAYRSLKFSLVCLLAKLCNKFLINIQPPADKSAVHANRFKEHNFPFEYIAVDDLHYYRRRKPCNCNKSVVSFLLILPRHLRGSSSALIGLLLSFQIYSKATSSCAANPSRLPPLKPNTNRTSTRSRATAN